MLHKCLLKFAYLQVEIHAAYIHLTRVRLTEEAHKLFYAKWKREKIYILPYDRSEV